MQKEHMIPARTLCTYHQIELSFIHSLREYGLIEIVEEGQEEFIPEEMLPDIEKFSRLRYELDINMEGIDAIDHLLKKQAALQEEINSLRNRLRLYEKFI